MGSEQLVFWKIKVENKAEKTRPILFKFSIDQFVFSVDHIF